MASICVTTASSDASSWSRCVVSAAIACRRGRLEKLCVSMYSESS